LEFLEHGLSFCPLHFPPLYFLDNMPLIHPNVSAFSAASSPGWNLSFDPLVTAFTLVLGGSTWFSPPMDISTAPLALTFDLAHSFSQSQNPQPPRPSQVSDRAPSPGGFLTMLLVLSQEMSYLSQPSLWCYVQYFSNSVHLTLSTSPEVNFLLEPLLLLTTVSYFLNLGVTGSITAAFPTMGTNGLLVAHLECGGSLDDPFSLPTVAFPPDPHPVNSSIPSTSLPSAAPLAFLLPIP